MCWRKGEGGVARGRTGVVEKAARTGARIGIVEAG